MAQWHYICAAMNGFGSLNVHPSLEASDPARICPSKIVVETKCTFKVPRQYQAKVEGMAHPTVSHQLDANRRFKPIPSEIVPNVQA